MSETNTKKCSACKAELHISKFSKYKRKSGVIALKGICKRCVYARDSKKGFKRNVNSFVDQAMFGITGKDY